MQRATVETEPFILALAFGLAVLSVAFSQALPFALFPAVAVIALKIRSGPQMRKALARPRSAWGYLAGFAAITALITPFPDITTPQVVRLWLGIACALLVQIALSASPSGRLWLKEVTLAIIVLAAAFAIATPLMVGSSAAPGIGWIQSLPGFVYASSNLQRVAGDTANPNVLGGLSAYFLPCLVAVSIFQAKQSRTLIIMGLIASSVTLVALWFSNSRGALLGATIGLLTAFAFRSKRHGLLVGTLLALLASAFLIWFGPTTLPNLLTLGGAKEGPEYRLELWSRAWYIIQDFPFTGIGMGSFEPVVDLLYPLIIGSSVPHAHNLFLQIAVDLGIPGLIAWLAILYTVLRACWRVYRNPAAPADAKALAVGIFAAQIAMCTHGLVDAVLWGMVRTAPLVWLMWGIALGMEQSLSAPEKTIAQTTA